MTPYRRQGIRKAHGSDSFVVGGLALSLLCSAASAAFEGTTVSMALQLAGIVIPLALGVALAGRRFAGAPVWRRSPEAALLTFLFLLSATVSACLAAAKYFDGYPLAFNTGTILAFIVWGGIWALDEESVWSAFRLYGLLSTAAIVTVWIATRHSGERFQSVLHPNLWGLLCFTNFCVSGLIRGAIVRVPMQVANILVILDAQSRSALLSTLVAAAVMCFFAARATRVRKEDAALMLIAAAVVCALLGFLLREKLVEYFAVAFRLNDLYRGSATGFSGRVELWQRGLAMIESNLLFGVGPRMEGNYITGDIQYSHSGYLSTLAQYGVIGGTLFFSVALLRARALWRMAMRRRPGAWVGAALIFGYAAEAAFEPKLLSIGNPASLLVLAFLLLPARAMRAGGRVPLRRRAVRIPISDFRAPVSAPGPRLPEPLRKAATAGIAILVGLISANSVFAARPPDAAIAAGFKVNTFSSRFSTATVDVASGETSGFDWYPFHFFHQPLPDPSGLTFHSDGSLTLGAGTDIAGTNRGPESKISICTAAPAGGPSRWIGRAFGGGGYFEAVLKVDPRDVANAGGNSQWPAFWSMAIEHLAELGAEQWEGQVEGYNHFIEADFFEYDVWKFSAPEAYGGALREWYGVYKSTCPGESYCQVSNSRGGGTDFANFVIHASAGTDFSRFHRFGFLWIPATDISNGYAEYYFDGKPTADRITWSRFRGQPGPPGPAPWTFGIIDRQHLAILLDSGPGQPMTVKSVNVWQASTDGNWKQ
jgi:hypothetical protein